MKMTEETSFEDEPESHPAGVGRGISGNSCRCQDYDKILTALMKGAENMRRA
jgi:aerobic-type carbon monoxide dehydrogenase small subunit (CoxS/CutS family)